MSMVPIMCDACDGTAAAVEERLHSNSLDGCKGVCMNCKAPGKVRLIGDDDSGVRFFPSKEAS